MQNKATLTAKQGAEYLGVSYWRLLEMVKGGEIPHIRVSGGKRILFRKESLDKWLQDQEEASVRRVPEPSTGKIRRLK